MLIAAARVASNTPSSVDPAYPSSSSSKSWLSSTRGKFTLVVTLVRIQASLPRSFLNPHKIVEVTIWQTIIVIVFPKGESSTVRPGIYTFILTLAPGRLPSPPVVVQAEISIALNQLTLHAIELVVVVAAYLHDLNHQDNWQEHDARFQH